MKKPHEYLFALYDEGEMVRTLDDGLTAREIALDPRFDKKLTVRTYKLLKRSEEPKGVPVKCWREKDEQHLR